MHSSVDMAPALAAALIGFLILERIVYALVGIVWSDESELKQTMSYQFINSFIELISNIVFSVLYSALSLASALVTTLLWVSIVMLLGSVMYVTYEQAPWVWTDLARAYNAFLGPFVNTTIVGTADIVNTIFKGVVPLWNGFFFFLSRLLSGYFLPTVISESVTFGKIGVSLYEFSKHSSISLFSWVQPVAVTCPVSEGDACFSLVDRTLDIVTPMANVRDVVGHFVGVVRNICDPITPIFDIVTFPFMDLNLAKGVHNIVNSILYLVVQMPEITHLRCSRHGDEASLMCTPDMDPFFSFLTTGIRDIGRMIDNWVEVIFVIVQGVLGTRSAPACESSVLSPPMLSSGQLRSTLFGSNQTVVVGLGGWLMAVTDGVIIAYHGQGKMRMAAWPSVVNVSHGVAAVTYSTSSDRDVTRLSSSAYASTATALMGCKCLSNGQRIQLQCAVMPYEGLLANQSSFVPVFFQQGSTIEQALQCSDIDIVVQSVRWPATRFSSVTTPLPDCSLSRTCNQVDATVWVVPRSNCDRESTVCSCHPFCMATRLAGSQASPLVLYSASQWRSKVYIVKRDCNLQSSSASMQDGLSVSSLVDDTPVVTTQVSGESPQFTASSVSEQTLSCTDNLLVTSIINRTVHPAYTNPTAAYLRDPSAPFVITGDTIFTSIKHGDGTHAVKVERLTGYTGSEFTLSQVTGRFPAYPPVRVPADLFVVYPKDHVTVPYARQATLAVSSRNFVFYAVNPSMHVYNAYLHYCRVGVSSSELPQFGLIMTSSFSPIRVWRVDAYRRCGPDGCGADVVRQADIPDAFSNRKDDDGRSLTWDCVRTYNEGITHMEYINEANIAITVHRTSVNGTISEYVVYWLNIATMAVSDTPWQDDAYQTRTALSAYTLCPSMQALPEVGSLMAELLVAAVLLVKMPVDLVAYMPGISSLWSTGMVCPLQTRGHTILQQCGSNAFLLDDFFNALETATSIFWSTLTLLSAAVDKATTDTDASRTIQNSLDGLARYGAGSIDLWTAQFGIMNVMAAGPMTTVQSMPTTVFAGAEGAGKWMQGGYKLTANTLGWARFGYTCIAKIVVTITQNVLLNKPVGAGRAWRIIVNALDEMREVYDGTVVENLRQSCAGISLMLGLTNPWAVFVYQQCVAANTVVSAGLDLFLSVFNLAPFAQCMCSGSTGKVFGEYAMANCVPQASTRLRPMLIQMVQSSAYIPSGDRVTPASALCRKMLDFTKSEMVGSVQPWFDAQFASMNALSSSVDYTLSWFDPKAGQCLNYSEDPDVVVIMPYPSDYFQACGSTSLCRARCARVWDSFDKSLAASSVKSTLQQVQVVVESLFFPVLTLDAFTPMAIRALVQPTPALCAIICGGNTNPGDTCLAVGGVGGGGLLVQYYCVPLMMTASVYRTVDLSLDWAVEGGSVWTSDLLKLQFGDGDGRTLVALAGTGDVWVSSASVSVKMGSVEQLTKEFGLQVVAVTDLMVAYRLPYASIHVNLLYRQVDGRITANPLHAKLVVDVSNLQGRYSWLNMGVSFFSGVHGYSVSYDSTTNFYPSASFLLLPTTPGLPVSLLTLQWDEGIPSNGVVQWSTFTLPESPRGLDNLLAGGQVLSQNCIMDSEGAYIAFIGAGPQQSTGWLSQARISGSVAETYVSRPTTFSVSVERQCNVKSCVGCPDGEVQRLCDALQRCAVINCIGTPVNMRRVLCQLGARIADESRENLAIMHGGWLIFVDMFMVIMDLSLQKGVSEVAIEWPDDRFFGYICTVKDQSAHYISIFTSAINSVLLAGHSAVAYLQGGAHVIDSNFHATTTMSMTALTGFLHQVLLYPIYALIVTQKVMMCRVQGVMAIFDSTGFKVTIGNANMQTASTSLVGRCLTQSAEAQMGNPSDGGNAGAAAGVVTSVANSAAIALLPELTFGGNSLETIIHAINGQLSYMMGVLLGLSDLLISMDMAHCKMPDYFLNETVLCACGDTPFAIPEPRRKEGVEGAGFWCTGTLSMLDASNRPFVIYNPFTYDQLQSMARGSDEYLACMSSKMYVQGSSDCSSLLPTVPEFEGVSVLSVLTACKNNYMNSQWDKAAYVLFNQSVFRQELEKAPPILTGLPPLVKRVGVCLQDPATRPSCLQEFLTNQGYDPEVYWSYEDIDREAPSQHVDGCQVFTGPAQNPDIGPAKRSEFRACLDQYGDSNCQISSNLWTPQSDNAVPVAHRHAVKLGSSNALNSVIELKFQEAYAIVDAALKPLDNYNNPDLRTIYFSPEGDIMHQMMDCVFMGPYTKVNYWPQDLLGLLPVPSWHRDADGTSRAVDARDCVKNGMDRSPPYSCGSHARQAVIKYFFRDYLPTRQNSTMNSIINSMTSDLRGVWSNISAYTCLCANNVSHSTACCQAADPGGWLPLNLRPSYQSLPTNTILRELTNKLKEFYRYSLEDPLVWTKYLPPDTLASYNWSADPVSAEIASHQAHFRTDKPVVGYSGSEARSPLVTTALWQQCHGALSQVFFTLPMVNGSSQWTARDIPSGNLDGVDALDGFIKAVVGSAFSSSPLYRHYNVSYVPSESRMCRKSAQTQLPWAKKIKVGSYSIGLNMVLNASTISSPPVYGPDSFPMHGCVCGWVTSGGKCYPPSDVCNAITSLCPFPVESVSAMELLKANWSPAWQCASTVLSDQWGLLDAREMDEWLAGTNRDYTVQGYDLLKRGRAGMRSANFDNITRQGRMVSPFEARTVQPWDAALPYCIGDFETLSDDSDQLRSMTRRLFPVSQGIYESGTAAYCLRYAVEAAFLAVLDMANLRKEYAVQRLVSDLWRTRCESQIALLSLCKGLDVFRPPVEFRRRRYPCPFSVALSETSDVYMTPGCLVHQAGVFYDPCNCAVFECGPTEPTFNQFVSECRIPFDPRNMTVDSAQLGGWRVSASEVFDSQGFVASVLNSDGLGNVKRGSVWASAEGRLSSTGRHCDMMADWWPEGSTLPVGYHATTSCSSDDTGYRTFDSAFAVERSSAAGQFTVVKMIYQNDLTRQASVIDTMAGAGGVCRSSNMGLPLIRTNRVRLCTRMQSGSDVLDPAMQPSSPIYASTLPDSSFVDDEKCSEDSSDVPWHDILGLHDSALHSVGTVPNMPSEEAATYPETAQVHMGVGPRSSIEEDIRAGGSGWGGGCSDFVLKECSSDSECPSEHFCLAPARICMHSDFKADTVNRCYRHDMCPVGLMCSGEGKCVQGHITFINDIQSPDSPDPVEAVVFSEQCDEVNSDTYKTDGASPWEYVPDWLDGHGMCSNKNWYTYILNLAGVKGCGATCASGSCRFNSRTCSLSLNQSYWWPKLKAIPSLFAVEPTVCDRDYEHMNGPTGARMVGCTPKSTIIENMVTDVDDARDASIEYARLFRNFDTDGSTDIGIMPLNGVDRTGFLGLSDIPPTSSLINCERFQNCYAYEFTYNREKVQRKYRQNGVDRIYSDDSIFKCGVAAYYDSGASKCRLDTRSMHLYTALCTRQYTNVLNKCTCRVAEVDSVGCFPVVDRALLDSICANIVTEFTANYDLILSNTKHLQQLFTVFLQGDDSLRAQVSGVECFEAIHSSMQDTRYGQKAAMSVYYPFTFALHEVPLAWIYQCSYIGGIKITDSPTKIGCMQYERSKNMSDVREGDSFNFNMVRAGYRRHDILRRIESFEEYVRAAIPKVASIKEFQDKCMLSHGRCEMIPYCANSLNWIPNSKMEDYTRKFIAGLYQYECIVSVRNSVLDERGQTFQEFIENNTVLTNYIPDPSFGSGMPGVVDIIADNVASCISEQYNTLHRWPFSLTFPSDSTSLQGCFRNSTPGVLNKLAFQLIQIGNPQTDVNQAYMPTSNIAGMQFTSIKESNPGGREPYTGADQACIFQDLNSQERVSNQQRLTALNPQLDSANRRFTNGVLCKQYPLTYMSGTQDCKYPIQSKFTSLAALMSQVWDTMSSYFFPLYQSLPAFIQSHDGVPPVELTFWQVDSGFTSWSYDVSAIRSYMSNINPDTTKEVMCVISDNVVNFTACNDVNYAYLKDFTDRQRQKAAPIVQHKKQLTWKVSREFLARGGVFAFANATRERKSVLLKNLFDDSARCGADERMYNRVCLLNNQAVRPWVPWMSGEWNPYEMCDVRELDVNSGNLEEIWPYDLSRCKNCGDANGQYRTRYMFDQANCNSKANTYAKFINVERGAPTNLCKISMNDRDRTCAHTQGMVGGGRGRTVLNHPTMPHLYGTNNNSRWPAQGGAFPRGDPVLRGEDSENDGYGFISIPGDELGSTGVGLTVESVPGGMPYLRVSHLPMLKQAGYMKNWKSQDVSMWTMGLRDKFATEDAIHSAEQAPRSSAAWDCPVRRVAYYSAAIRDSATFAPAIPSPGRARRLFGGVTGNLSTHPTQAVQRGTSGMGNYTTSNGFCYCPVGMPSDQDQCRIPTSDATHPCSLKRTIQALQGVWVQSHVFTPKATGGGDSSCKMQFDWPYVSGRLRDGLHVSGDYTWGSNTAKGVCHILDRLRPFQYRYKSDRPAVPAAGMHTTDQGGVCHTGRAATLTFQASAKVSTTRCLKQSETEDSVQVKCEDGSTMILSKEKSKPLDAMIEAVKASRMKCAQCSPPPTFVNSKNKSIPAESSFGIPFRFSASRMASADLKGVICSALGEHNCSQFLNTAAWEGADFMRTLLTSPSSLFADPPAAPVTPARVESTWPSGEWVFCNSTTALRAGDCRGSIPETAWRTDRFQSCYKTIRDATHDSPEVMSSVDVCLIDSNLQDLCTAVAKAQALVREANCLASGSTACALKPFLYQPSAWDVSNREFVHSTVTHFYKRVAPASCPDHSSIIVENNRAILNRCAATPVSAMYIALQACREITDTLADVLFYTLNIVVNGLRLITDFSGNRQSIIAQTVYFWEQVVHRVRNLLSVLSDMFFDMLFNMGSLGQRIYRFVQTSCGNLNTAYRYWLEVWCSIAIDLLPSALGAIRSTVQLCETGFGVLNDALDSIFTTMAPVALKAMQSRGYDMVFRDKVSRDQSRQRQEINDRTKKSRREGKKADAAALTAVVAIAGGAGIAGVGADDIAKSIALAALSNTKFGFIGDLAQGIDSAIEFQKLMAKYPQNWTLFDFASIYVALDVFEVYISSDRQCLVYREANATEIFNCTFPALASRDSMAGAYRVGTRCWADAQRDVGTSNLLACTESDTCYVSDFDRSKPIICGSCPIAGAGYSTYGCSAITKMCTCNVPTTLPSTCSSNQECSYRTSSCQLITSLDDMSYGNQPCADCSKDVQCLMRAGSGVGKCGCMFQEQPLQKCSQMPGQFVPMTDGSKLCGYLPNADRASALTAVQWESLAMVKCIYLKAANIFCTQAYRNGVAIPLAVGLAMASLSPSFQSRRLLVEGRMTPEGPFEVHSAESEYTLPESDEGHYLLSEDWNGTAEPCSSLAHAYQQAVRAGHNVLLGPIDTMHMHSCAYWRLVGRRAIEQYNLTSLRGRDGFLLSVDDFAAALSQRWVLVELISKPHALLFAASHSPLLKPLYAALLSLRSMAMSWARQQLQEVRARLPLNFTLDSNFTVDGVEERVGEEFTDEFAEDLEEEFEKEFESMDSTMEDAEVKTGKADTPTTFQTGRRLLQTDIKFAETWLAGPFTWPPPFFTRLNSQCNLATAILQIAHNIIGVLTPYYYGSSSSARRPPRGIWDNLPNLTCSTKMKPVPPADGLVSSIFHAVWDITGINPGYVREFFSDGESTNIFTITTSMLKCDFQAVTYCSAHRKDLFASAVLILMFFFILYYCANSIGISFTVPLLISFIGFVPLLLWYSYGMAFACVPMLPTCLMDDIVYTLNWMFPLQVSFPDELTLSPTCLGDSSRDTCLKRCSEPPISFVEWRDTMAFGLCYTSPSLCISLADVIGERDAISQKLYSNAGLVMNAKETRVNALLFCFGVTFVNLIPVILLVVVGLTSAAYLLYLPCVFVPKFLALVGQYLVYLHAKSRDD